MAVASIPNIAASFNLSESELYQQALVSFLREKKRQVLQARLEIMARYSADSLAGLQAMIAKGAVKFETSAHTVSRPATPHPCLTLIAMSWLPVE